MPAAPLITIAIIGAVALTFIGWACCVAGARADERDEAHGDVAHLPKPLRQRTFRDTSITHFHGSENSGE